jgi:hypothetical protein
MAKDSLTFALEGDVVLEQFAVAINNFNTLLNGLSSEVGGGAKVEWVIDQLYSGSAIAMMHGEYEDAKVVENIINAYEDVGDYLASGKEIPYSNAVKRNAQNLTNVLNGKISMMRFETPSRDITISGKSHAGEKSPPLKYSHGTIKGTIQTLSMRKKLSFTIWDSMFDRPINCYLAPGQEEMMRQVWGKRAIVSGKIGRQAETGKPVVVRDVRYIRTLEEPTPGSYKRAKGVIPWVEGDELPEDVIRRLRHE